MFKPDSRNATVAGQALVSLAVCILTVEIFFRVNRDYAIRRNTLRREDGVSSKRYALS